MTSEPNLTTTIQNLKMTSESNLTTTIQNLLSTNANSSSIQISSTNISDAHTSSVSSTIPKVLTTSTSSESPAFSTSTSGSLSSAGIGPSTSAGILSTTGQSSKGENLCHISCRISFVYTTMCIVHVFLMNRFMLLVFLTVFLTVENRYFGIRMSLFIPSCVIFTDHQDPLPYLIMSNVSN